MSQERVGFGYWFSGDVLNVMVNHNVTQLSKNHPSYHIVVEALKDNKTDDELVELLSNPTKARNVYIQNNTSSKVEVRDDGVYYNGNLLNDTYTKRIMEFVDEGLPFEPMAKLLENAMSNPSMRAKNDLPGFLERKGMPVTEDGCFLGYKGVDENYMDWYSGTVCNKVGCKPAMDRVSCDDNPDNPCSSGYHVGSLEFAKQYTTSRTRGGGGHLMVVKVNPKDVVSVPGNAEKMCVCAYEVVAEYKDSLNFPLCNKDLNRVESTKPKKDGNEWSWFNKPKKVVKSTNFHNVRGPDGRFAKK